MANLQYAEANIKLGGDGHNTINTNVVRAMISRFGLFEGTWLKYHELGGHEKFIDASIAASEPLIEAFPTLHPEYGEMFTSDLANVQGVILYKEFVETELTNYVLGHVERTSTHNVEMPQHILDIYLCQDGETIDQSDLYEWGDTDRSMYSMFRNRDMRLLHTVAPPYRVQRLNGGADWDYTGDPAHREYMDIMGITTNTGEPGPGDAGKHKVFPLLNWGGLVLQTIPHFSTNNEGVGYIVARSGNYVYKHYNVWDNSREGQGTIDVPLFKIEEVLLNYAEAKYEKGSFTQADADQTINRLRARGQVAPMIVSSIDASFDASRDPSVDPVLWEIRRERIIELMGEGFGFYDVRRWKKADWFVNHIQYGQWATKEQIGGAGRFVDLETGLADATGKTEGYIYMYNDPVKSGQGWLDKYYLYQVPTDEIVLNPQLDQNPGY